PIAEKPEDRFGQQKAERLRRKGSDAATHDEKVRPFRFLPQQELGDRQSVVVGQGNPVPHTAHAVPNVWPNPSDHRHEIQCGGDGTAPMMGETDALELRESFGDSPLQTGKNELVSVPVKGTSVIINCVASPEEQPV